MKTLNQEYQQRHGEVLCPLAQRLEQLIRDQFSSCPRIDRIGARAKSPDRFLAKAQKQVAGTPKYSDPFNQIQDQIGARIITFYKSDVEEISMQVERYYRPIESHLLIPESDAEFGYVGKHYILHLPTDILDEQITESVAPKFFELQIKTLFQHAWSEANHDLGYKPSTTLSSDQKRKLAFTAAQAWGADLIFAELHTELAGSATGPHGTVEASNGTS